ncbi:hypothetical protein BDV28DRAFT_128796 [Aspergillus coremiiformis]|uniref:Uncharacterized protein n=1 Tax=Aspergillus coremiiformis TaxID=138285 RepID=A0A5N6ZFE8_9EURO|nr:hypothetical protein BDV28DRAFT_128796 [Aspergillus coremiiformis]
MIASWFRHSTGTWLVCYFLHILSKPESVIQRKRYIQPLGLVERFRIVTSQGYVLRTFPASWRGNVFGRGGGVVEEVYGHVSHVLFGFIPPTLWVLYGIWSIALS